MKKVFQENKKYIKVWNFNNRKLKVTPTGKEVYFNQKQKEFIEENFKEKRKNGWADSWIATIKKIEFSKKQIKIKSSAIKFSQVNGWLNSIKNNKKIFPEIVPSISIGIFPITSDGFLIFTRRNLKELHAPGIWNIPGGYMNSMLVAGKENCSDLKYKKDKRVFDIKIQANLRAHKQEFYGLSKNEINFSRPFALSLGNYHSHEYEIALIGKLKKTKNEIKKHIRNWEFVKGLREHVEIKFVKIVDIPNLLKNQLKIYKKNFLKYNSANFQDGNSLSSPLRHSKPQSTNSVENKKNSIKHESKSDKEFLVLDDNIGELVVGYKKISGKELEKDFVEELKKNLRIKIFLKKEYLR